MVTTQEENNISSNENFEEWINLSKWGTVFLITVIIPHLGLVYFWVKYKPIFNVFLSITVSYLIVTLILLKSLLLNIKGQENK